MSTLIGLFVILFIAAIAAITGKLKRKWTPEAQQAAIAAMRPPRAPFGVFVDSAHSWVKLMSDGTMRIGVDDFIAEALGRVDGVELPEPGHKIERGDTLVTLRVGEKLLRVPSPISGEVAAHNATALQSPATLTADPYGLGWLLSLRTQDHKEAIKPLHLGNGALGYLRQELARLGDFFTARASTSAAPLMADGGLPQRGAVADLDDAGLERFADEFISQR
jgi:glycine cleavage system H protein